MKNVLVTGSLAYDYLYTFPSRFQDSFVTKSTSTLSVAFNVSEKTIHFGGCAGNIVYSGALLKAPFVLVGIAGKDFWEYEEWLAKNNIISSSVIRRDDTYTSQAAVITDSENQQITFFYPGAADQAGLHREDFNRIIDTLAPKSGLAILAPNSKDFMMIMFKAFQRNSLPFVFDPGQTIPLFTPEELRDLIKKSAGCIANRYEADQLMQRLGLTEKRLTQLSKFTIITDGASGSSLFFHGDQRHIPAPEIQHAIDPTGCGDAYRGGLLSVVARKGLTHESLLEGCTKGTELAVQCLGVIGTQNHT